MWKVDPPTVTPEEVARECVKRITDKDRAARVKKAAPNLAHNSLALQQRIANHSVAGILASPPAVTGITDDEMKWLYDSQLAQKGRPAYQGSRQRLLAAAPYGQCSYCQFGVAKTLDHFVPKSLIPALSIDPWNLIPCCHQCNHEIGDAFSLDPAEQFLHPYAMPHTGQWLSAKVEHTDPVTVSFAAEPASTLNRSIAARIIHQFTSFELAAMYSVASASEIAQLSLTFVREYGHGKPQDTRKSLLQDAAGALEENENSRRGVMLQALADDSWFCSTGYSLAKLADAS
jgi:5-methylcytosine-specific restriction endonuclease McrA